LFTVTQEETVATEIAGEISPQDELVEIQSPEKIDKTKLEKLEQDPLFTLTREETVATEIAGEDLVLIFLALFCPFSLAIVFQLIHLQDLSPLLFQWLLFPLELV
jgi:hypothetical protein